MLGPDFDPNCGYFDHMVFLKEFFEKVDCEKNAADDKMACKITQ